MTDRQLMMRAIDLARVSYSEWEVPVGAVVSLDGEIIGEGRNRCEREKSAVEHAEIEAIRKACKKLGRRRLKDCVLYVTLEPCPMCAGAAINAGVKKIVFGAYDVNMGACVSRTPVFNSDAGKTVTVQCGFMEKECASLLTSFFEEIRKNNQNFV